MILSDSRLKTMMIGLCLLISLPVSALETKAGPLQVQKNGPTSSPLSEKKILLLYSFGYGLPAYEKLNPALLSVFRKAGLSLASLNFEYLDLGRFKDKAIRRSLANLLSRKYSGKKPDLIITVYIPALDFLLQECQGISPDIPIISLFGPDSIGKEGARRNIVLLPIRFDFKGTLEQALKLFPETKKIELVGGSGNLEKRHVQYAQNDFKPWQNNYQFEYISTLSIEEVLDHVKGLSPGTIIIFSNFVTDRTGRSFIPQEVVRRIAGMANVPVFGTFDTLLGTGITGGSMLSFEAEGRQTGQLALDILTGKFQFTQPVTTIISDKIPMFDWRQLERWKGKINRLPKESLFINRPFSIWEQYKKYIIAAIAVVLLQFFLIISLLLQKQRRKIAEESLRASEERYRTVIEQSNDGVALVKGDRHVFVNQKMVEIFGYDRPEEIISQPIDLIVHPDDQERVKNINRRRQEGETVPQKYEFKGQCKNGEPIYIEVSATRTIFQGEAVSLAYLRDITARKRAEESLRSLSSRQEAMLAAIPDIIMEVDDNKVYTWANQASLGFFGGDVVGKEAAFYFEGEQDTYQWVKPLFNGEENTIYVESWQRRRDGQKRLLAWWCRVLKDEEGKVTGALSTARDITERKKAEINNRLMVDILQLLNQTETRETLINRLLGLIKQTIGIEAIGLRLRSGDDFPYYFINGYSSSFVEKENFLCPRDLKGAIIRNTDGLPVLECTCGLVLSGQADLSLPFFTKGGSFWTNEASKLLELKPEEDPRTNPRNNCIYEGYESIALVPLRSDQEIIGLLHSSLRRKDFFTIETIQFLEDIASCIGIALHRMQNEDQIRASLKEKEVMLQEIHHRVKNNLQVIQSLLNLQAGKIEDHRSQEVFKESQDRIRAMALVHEKLYRSPDLSHIDMADYLRDLSTRLFHSSQANPDKVKLKLGVEEVQIGIDKAIPVGLILNELISNALKHAFPGGREGEIRVGLARAEGGLLRLTVGNNGFRFPEEVDFRKNESMGFIIVTALVEQLGGTIELNRDEGTEFRITFPEGK